MTVAQLVDEFRGRMEGLGGFQALEPLHQEFLSRLHFDTIAAHPESVYLVQDLRHWSGQAELAAQILERALHYHPTNRFMMILCAQRAIDAGRYSLVKRLADRIAAIDPDEMTDQEERNACRVFSAIGYHDKATGLFANLAARNAKFATPMLGSRLNQAIENRKLVDGISVYSIGEDCRPWLVLNRWGLREDPREELMTDFTLEATKTNTVTKVIREENTHVTDELAVFHEADGNNFPMNHSLDIMFNHNRGPWWTSVHYHRLRTLYLQRRRNRLASYDGGPRVYVHYSHFPGADLDALVDAVKGRQKNENYRIAVISSASDAPTRLSDAGVFYGRTSVPMAPYRWFGPEAFETDRGIQYEAEIASVAKAAIADLRGSQGLGFKLNAAKRRLSRRAL